MTITFESVRIDSTCQAGVSIEPRSLSDLMLKPASQVKTPSPKWWTVLLLFCVISVLSQPASAAPTTIIVAQDGSGQFKTVQEAVMSVPAGTAAAPVVIRIKPGTYKEY